MNEDWKNGGFGLYVHWPFCEAKCPYCDFNSYVSAKIDTDSWGTALVSEIKRHAEITPGRLLNSIFFGGGTPSLMPPKIVGDIIDTALKIWTPANDIEITLEANPSSVEVDRFAGYRAAGVNRVSLGVQALNDNDLRALGRLHSVQEAMLALDIAHKNFDRVSFDLIYARQKQSLASWEAELKQALLMSSGHLSLYQLSVEPGTAFGFRAKAGKLGGLPDEDLSADMFELTNEMCSDAGHSPYEISNYSADGLESIHNIIYWRGGDYVGVGPGAHGRITTTLGRHATQTALAPFAWLERVEQKKSATLHSIKLHPIDHANELIMMGLRLSGGISISRISDVAGRAISVPENLFELGLIELHGDNLRASLTGRPLLNQIIQGIMF